jgi:hypothetical protein
MKKSYLNKKTLALVLSVGLLLGCETGTSNKAPVGNDYKIDSGIVSQNKNYKPHTPKDSQMNKIYTNSGTPGYYIQVGYFGEQRPNADIINRLKFADLPYEIIKKSKKSYLLVGPYTSYNKAREIKGSAKEYVSEDAFIVKVLRP